MIARIGDSLLAEIASCKAAVGKFIRQEMKRASASAANVEDADTALEARVRPGTRGRM